MKSLKHDSDLQKAVLKTSHGRRTQAVDILFVYLIVTIDRFVLFLFQTGATAAEKVEDLLFESIFSVNILSGWIFLKNEKCLWSTEEYRGISRTG